MYFSFKKSEHKIANGQGRGVTAVPALQYST